MDDEEMYWDLMADPRCYICGGNFRLRCRRRRNEIVRGCDDSPLQGLYPAQVIQELREPPSWKTWRRMIIFDASTCHCQISGLSFDQGGYHSVPWDKNKCLIGFFGLENDSRITRPQIAMPNEEFKHYRSLVGYPIHDRCWEYFSMHAVGAHTEKNLSVVVHILHQMTSRHFFISGFNQAWEKQDPMRSEPLEKMIEHCRQKRKDGVQWRVRRNPMPNCLLSLPAELRYTILNHLRVREVHVVERAISWRAEDRYWRSRIPVNLFHELKDVWEENLDWPYLCRHLEQLAEKPLGALACRRHIFDRLDMVQSAITAWQRDRESLRG